ncbi:uncharacterized protein LOC110842207 [Folsomia candida]|uniref:uncharacterized protein LOC110842207 n=1 Tax=Folsomia candida TaxID=158441 RepID=UPI000B8F0063|nr:uncharacterized protein LOC110842207 [Folsomia candida]
MEILKVDAVGFLLMSLMVQISNSLTFPIDPPQQQYYENELGDHTFDGQSAVLGGLLGGGIAAATGGFVSPEFSLAFGAFGGTIGGAIGAFEETERNGLSVIGGAIGGALGAGAGAMLGNKIRESGWFGFAKPDAAFTLPLSNLSNAIPNPLNLVSSKPLESIEKAVPQPLKEIAAKPLEMVGKPAEVLEKPLQAVGKPGEILSKPVEAVGSGPAKILEPLKALPNPLSFGKRSMVDGLTQTAGLATSLATGDGILKALFKPLYGAAISGLFGALGGGLGAYIGAWGFDVINNLL